MQNDHLGLLEQSPPEVSTVCIKMRRMRYRQIKQESNETLDTRDRIMGMRSAYWTDSAHVH